MIFERVETSQLCSSGVGGLSRRLLNSGFRVSSLRQLGAAQASQKIPNLIKGEQVSGLEGRA